MDSTKMKMSTPIALRTFAIAGATFALAFPCAAQKDPAPPSTIEENAPKKPEPDPDIKPDNNKPLSEKLEENEGVLKPPPEVDPNISKPPPKDAGQNMPVIIPPGEPGGDQSVQPK